MAVTYRLNHRHIKPEDALDIYRRSGLKRPQDLRRIENMLQHSNVIVTAWDDTKLIGMLRAMTDFSFDDDNVLIMLISAQNAIGFYESLGFASGCEPYGQTMCMSVTKNEMDLLLYP